MPTVPEVLLRKLYVQGSLDRLPDGFTFQLKDTLLAVTIIGMQISADGAAIAAENLSLQLEGGEKLKADTISAQTPFALPLNVLLRLEAKGVKILPANLTIDALTSEAGPLRFTVSTKKNDSAGGGSKQLQQVWTALETAVRSIKAANDPHHPLYHFTPPANWMNDPNGLVAWKGKTHLFYQYNPYAPVWGLIHWGHAVSHDLVHWMHYPIALTPCAGTPNADGCWSGSAVVTDEGPVFFYTAVFPETVCMARPDQDFLRLMDDPENPVIAAPPEGMSIEGFRDPCVWWEDGACYMTIGSGIKGVGGAVLLYRSSDLKKWEFVHPLLVGDSRQAKPFATGTMWECPQLVHLGNWDFLFLSVIVDPKTQYSIYFRGKMEKQLFIPESMHRVDEGGGTLYAPLTFEDDSKRRILFGWIREERDENACKRAGWAGVLSLPRMLSTTENGDLLIDPAPEIKRLRKFFLASFSGLLRSEPTLLSGSHGLKNIEVSASIELLEGSAIEFLLAESPQSAEKTRISYDSKEGVLMVDTIYASLVPSARGSRKECSLVLKNGEPLTVDIFFDGSVLEVYANRKVVMTSRLYPTRMADLRLFGSSTGSQVKITSLQIHQLGSCFSRK